MTMVIHGHNYKATLGLYSHWQHLILIYGQAKVLLLMLVNSSHGLDVLARTGTFIRVI
jgi:hypothetical protein